MYNTDTDKYFYSVYGILFDTQGTFALSDSGIGKNLIMFGAENRNRFLYNGKGLSLSREAKYFFIFS